MVTKKAVAKKSSVIGIKVRFELITKDKTRRVIFGLEKDTEGNVVTWKIDFQFVRAGQERGSLGRGNCNSGS